MFTIDDHSGEHTDKVSSRKDEELYVNALVLLELPEMFAEMLPSPEREGTEKGDADCDLDSGIREAPASRGRGTAVRLRGGRR